METAYVSPAGPITPLDIIYGHRGQIAAGNLFMAHRCGFSEAALRDTLAAGGFTSIATCRRPAPAFDLWAVACKSPVVEAELRVLAAAHFPVRIAGVI